MHLLWYLHIPIKCGAQGILNGKNRQVLSAESSEILRPDLQRDLCQNSAERRGGAKKTSNDADDLPHESHESHEQLTLAI